MKTLNPNLPENVKAQIEEICAIIEAERSVEIRVEKVKQNYTVVTLPMGSGGVGQVKESEYSYKVQLESGHGRYNYARTAVISK